MVEDFLVQLRPLDPSEYPSAEKSLENKLKEKQSILLAEIKSFIEGLISSQGQQQSEAIKALIKLLLSNKRYAKSLASVLNTTRKSKSYLQRLLTKILGTLFFSPQLFCPPPHAASLCSAVAASALHGVTTTALSSLLTSPHGPSPQTTSRCPCRTCIYATRTRCPSLHTLYQPESQSVSSSSHRRTRTGSHDQLRASL